MRFLLLAATMLLAGNALAAESECIPSGADEDTELSGTLDHEIFPGPPNFADVTQGDEPEPTYILRLEAPICLSGDDFIEDSREVRRVHLAYDAVDTDLKRALRSAIGADVSVTVRDLFGAHTGHHHAPIVGFVTGISRLGQDGDVDEGGTAATTVRGFYLALEVGDGETASSFVIPEKRESGPFAPDSLSNFYGNLREPLELQSVRRIEAGQYEARYTFETHGGKFCDGLSIVTTTVREGRNLIERIRAPNGC